MQAYNVLLLYRISTDSSFQHNNVRNALKKIGLEDFMMGKSEESHSLPQSMLIGEFMAATPEQCRALVYQRVEQVFQKLCIDGHIFIIVNGAYTWMAHHVAAPIESDTTILQALSAQSEAMALHL